MTLETCDIYPASTRTMRIIDRNDIYGFTTFASLINYDLNMLHSLLSVDDIVRVYIDDYRWLGKTDFMKIADVYCNVKSPHFKYNEGLKICGVDWTAYVDENDPTRLKLHLACYYNPNDEQGRIYRVMPTVMFTDEEIEEDELCSCGCSVEECDE